MVRLNIKRNIFYLQQERVYSFFFLQTQTRSLVKFQNRIGLEQESLPNKLCSMLYVVCALYFL